MLESLSGSPLLELGVGIVAIYLVLRMVFDFLLPILNKRVEDRPERSDVIDKVEQSMKLLENVHEDIEELRTKIADLHAWHNVRTVDGGFVWYVPSSLEKAIEQLAKSIDVQTSVMRELITESRDTKKAVERLERQHQHGIE